MTIGKFLIACVIFAAILILIALIGNELENGDRK